MYEIEKNVEIPSKVKNSKRTKYPFCIMGVGDSFSLTSKIKETVRVASYNYGIRNGRKFKVGKDNEGVIRCWRIE